MSETDLDPDYDYKCFHCGTVFQRHVWSLDRSSERVHFGTAVPEVEVEDSEGLACYCSGECMNQHTPEVMRQEGVPIPALRPGIDPIEQCALCKGPVDMSDYHLAYENSRCEQTSRLIMQPHDVEYLAVICRTCRPRFASAASQEEAHSLQTAVVE